MKQDLFDRMIDFFYIDRDPEGIKSDFGRTLIIGGSREYPGAAKIAASLCLSSGCGFVSLAVPDSIFPLTFSSLAPTIVRERIPSKEDDFLLDEKSLEHLNSYSAILFGNGIATSELNLVFLRNLVKAYKGFLVLDASSLSLLAMDPSLLERKNADLRILLTPHLGEAGRLFHCGNRGRDPKAYVDQALSFCKQYDVLILLKSSRSLLVDSQFVQEADQIPTPSLGKAGSGDGLAGLLSGFLSYGRKAFPEEEVILFADILFHEAARLSAAEKTPGLASVRDVPSAIQEIVLKRFSKRTHRKVGRSL